MKKVVLIAAALGFFASPALADSARMTPAVKVIQRCAPAVVNISTEQLVLLRQNPFWGAYGTQLDDYFNQYSKNYVGAMKFPSVGSGVLVTDDGIIVTNAHVIHMANKIFVTFSDGSTQEAALLGTSVDDDLALIKVKNPKAKPVPLAHDVMLGETVIAIGNPLGLQNSVSTGVISGTSRSFASSSSRAFTDLLQTDASINPGSSGGALLNLDGELEGINLAVVQNAQNIGFAVPAKKVQSMLEEYRKVVAQKTALK